MALARAELVISLRYLHLPAALPTITLITMSVTYWGILTCLIWKYSIYGNPPFWLRSTLNCSSQFNHHMKIFSETSVDLTISMASYPHSSFSHYRSFIVSSRKIFPSDTILRKRFPKGFQEPPCLIMPHRFR